MQDCDTVALGFGFFGCRRLGQKRAHGGYEPVAVACILSSDFPDKHRPVSISVILTLMASASVKGDWVKSIVNYAVIALVILSMCLILYLFLSQGRRIMRKIGTSGSIIINKMVAFFTFCVGIQIVVAGITKVFHLNVL